MSVELDKWNRKPCPDPQCGALSGHHPRCSLQSLEEKAEKMLHYYEAWLKIEMAVRRREDHANKRVQRANTEITKWQGKFRIVCHENNVLRRKLQRADTTATLSTPERRQQVLDIIDEPTPPSKSGEDVTTSYFTFGFGHVHSIGGFTYDKDVVVKITAADPRQVMFDAFGRQWAMQYDSLDELKPEYYPRGIKELP